MSAINPSKAVYGMLNCMDSRFRAMGIRGLEFFTGIIRKQQKKQDAVSSELIREAREAQTLFEAIIADGVVTEGEREQLLRLLREMETELVDGRVIEGSGR